MLNEQSPVKEINHFKLYNNKIDQYISEALANNRSENSSFSWLLSIQISAYDVNDAESNEPVSNDNLYLSIPLPRAVSPNLYAKPSDYLNITSSYATLTQQKNVSLGLNFLNAFKPNSLHWQTDQQVLPSEVLNNLAWHKRIALENSIPDSIDKLKEYDKAYGKAFDDQYYSNDLADALLSQIKVRA